MPRFSTLAALLLVALWLPVTMHCQLENAGLFECDGCCMVDQATDTGAGCKGDACPSVEEALFKESSATLTVSAPSETDGTLCLALADPLGNASAEPDLSPARHAPPMELKVAWQFLSRAALPARAPSLNS